MKKLLTLDDLYQFYANKNETCAFNAADSDEPIVVHVNEKMSFDSEYDPKFGLLKTHLQSCHLYRNRNRSSISEESMLQAIPSFYNRPILGKIHQLSDGSYDFAGHEMSIDKDGNIEYEEIPVGVIPESCNAKLVYDEEKDKTYLEVDGYIYEEYTRAADILREKGECKVSVEISVDEMTYSAKDKVLNIDKFHFLGVTILGCTDDEDETPIEEGMYGSNIQISDFSKQNNSLFANDSDYEDKLMKILEDLQTKIDKISSFSINENFQKGGNEVSKFEELLEKYGKTEEDIDFDYSEMSDEELEAKFAELFEVEEQQENSEEAEVEPTPENNEGEPEGDDGDPNEGDEKFENEGNFAEEPEVEPESELEQESETPEEPEPEPELEQEEVAETFQKVFAISHEDIKCALYNLLLPYEEADNDYYYISAVYDNYFAYEGWMTGAIYGQNYTKDGDNVAFDGERFNLHRELLTDSEYAEIQNMRANYSSIKEKLASYELKEMNAKREAVLNAEEYSVLADNADFAELRKNMENYTVEELSEKADLIFAKHVKATKNFSFAAEKPQVKTVNFGATSNTVNEVNEPYGGIFKNFKKDKENKNK